MGEQENIKIEIRELAKKFREELASKTAHRIEEMSSDDDSHFLIYRVLGVSAEEGVNIDVYQNKGRFLYKYAGSFLEQATILCFKAKFPLAQQRVMITNTLGKKPKKFEIDCLVGDNAYEIKWRDATTDGDHITKEHTRIQVIRDAGLTPIRIMFYYPNRTQSIRIQKTLETLYHGIGGEYYFGDSAWEYVQKETGIDLLKILEEIASEVDSE